MKNRVSEASRTTALLLAFFFGTLGIHRLFLGYRRSGFVQFIVTLLLYIVLFIFLHNHPFFLTDRFDEPILVSAVLADYRLLMAILMPLGLIQLWVYYDIIRLALGYYKDASGRMVKLWTMQRTSF